jgi:hypothetical protein
MLCRHRDHQIKFWFQNREKGRGCHVTGRWSQWEGAPEREPAERAARPLGPRPRRRGSSAHFRARGRVTRVPPSWLGVTRPVTLPAPGSPVSQPPPTDTQAILSPYSGDTHPILWRVSQKLDYRQPVLAAHTHSMDGYLGDTRDLLRWYSRDEEDYRMTCQSVSLSWHHIHCATTPVSSATSDWYRGDTQALLRLYCGDTRVMSRRVSQWRRRTRKLCSTNSPAVAARTAPCVTTSGSCTASPCASQAEVCESAPDFAITSAAVFSLVATPSIAELDPDMVHHSCLLLMFPLEDCSPSRLLFNV